LFITPNNPFPEPIIDVPDQFPVIPIIDPPSDVRPKPIIDPPNPIGPTIIIEPVTEQKIDIYYFRIPKPIETIGRIGLLILGIITGQGPIEIEDHCCPNV
jgi:hypothetical protein